MRTKTKVRKQTLAHPKDGRSTKLSPMRRIQRMQLRAKKSGIPHRLSGRELLSLSDKEASRVMERAVREASEDYRPDGELRVFEANDPISEY